MQRVINSDYHIIGRGTWDDTFVRLNRRLLAPGGEGGRIFEKWAILFSGQNHGWPDFKSFDHKCCFWIHDSSPKSINELLKWRLVFRRKKEEKR
eukprot:scaffold23495_cov74-Cyclotella_meneghiniana.AAC.4